MNSQEAKFILQAYRHNGDDAKDPHFQEALEQVARDPELAEWLAEDQRLFQTISRGLKTIQAPGDLKTNILAGGKIARPRIWWQQPGWLAAAAVVFILLSLGMFYMGQKPTKDFASFRQEMSEYLDTRLTKLDVQTNSVNFLQQFLAKAEAPFLSQVPIGLMAASPLGCKIIDHHGSKVSLLCFRDGGTLVHLFIVDNPIWSNPPPAKARTLFAQNGFWTTASWRQGKQAFILASKTDEETLRKYL